MARPRLAKARPSNANTPEFIQWVVETYKDDFNGYRADILGMKPEPWQDEVGTALQAYRRVAVQSGHGIGKTAFCSSAIHWFLATRPNPAIVATANTEVQLATKLWRELAKVNEKAVNKDWFDWQATRFSLASNPTAFAQAITWNENNSEAFAGTHEDHVLGIFDEASGIPPAIWTTFAGAMTKPDNRWLATGNPTMNTGYFYEACNGTMKWTKAGDEKLGKWKGFTVGSGQSSFVSPEWIAEMRATLRADEFRVRVLGLPPEEALDQFIPPALVEEAIAREVELDPRSPLILGVDVARQGADKTVIIARKGNYVFDRVLSFQGQSLKDTAHRVAREVKYWEKEHGLKVRAVFIEGGGSLGWGCIEELWELGYQQVHDVNPGARSPDPELHVNTRCMMWDEMKKWLDRGKLPQNGDLKADMILPRRKPDVAMRLRLESKDEMRRRAGRSTDYADALALTFAAPVEREPEKKSRDDYDLYGTIETTKDEWMKF